MKTRTRESGVSPLVAEILMVSLVLLCAIVAYLVIFQVPAITEIPPVAVQITKSGELVSLAHLNGEPLEQGEFFVTINGDRVADRNMSLVGGAYPWSAGETLRVNTTGFTPARDVKLIYTGGSTNFVLASAYFLAASGNITRNATPTPTPTPTPVIYTRYPGFTVEAWVKWNVPPNPGTDTTRRWATIVVDGDSDRNRRYHLQHNQNNNAFEFAAATNKSNPQVWSTTSPVANTWYYVVGIYNRTDPANRLRIYVNGVNEASVTLDGGGLKASPNRYQVGGPAGIQWPGPTSMLRKFNGSISGLHTYEEAFSRQEILAHYAAGVP